MRASLLVALLVAAPSFAQQTPADTTREAEAVPVDPVPSPYAMPAPSRERPLPRPAPPPVAAPRVFDAFGEFGIAFGGDDVAELLFTDGGSQTLTAGQGGVLSVGASYTALGYTAEDGQEIDASHVGLAVRLRASDL